MPASCLRQRTVRQGRWRSERSETRRMCISVPYPSPFSQLAADVALAYQRIQPPAAGAIEADAEVVAAPGDDGQVEAALHLRGQRLHIAPYAIRIELHLDGHARILIQLHANLNLCRAFVVGVFLHEVAELSHALHEVLDFCIRRDCPRVPAQPQRPVCVEEVQFLVPPEAHGLQVIFPVPHAPLRVIDEQVPRARRVLHGDVVLGSVAAADGVPEALRAEWRAHALRDAAGVGHHA